MHPFKKKNTVASLARPLLHGKDVIYGLTILELTLGIILGNIWFDAI
jgi:hypothetical protein